MSAVGRFCPPFSIHLLFFTITCPFSSFLGLYLHTCLCPRLLRLSAWLNAGVMVRELRFQALGSEQGCRGRRTSIFKAMASYCVKAVCQYEGKSLPAQASKELLSPTQRWTRWREREKDKERESCCPAEVSLLQSSLCTLLSVLRYPIHQLHLSLYSTDSSFSSWASGLLVLCLNTPHL